MTSVTLVCWWRGRCGGSGGWNYFGCESDGSCALASMTGANVGLWLQRSSLISPLFAHFRIAAAFLRLWLQRRVVCFRHRSQLQIQLVNILERRMVGSFDRDPKEPAPNARESTLLSNPCRLQGQSVSDLLPLSESFELVIESATMWRITQEGICCQHRYSVHGYSAEYPRNAWHSPKGRPHVTRPSYHPV